MKPLLCDLQAITDSAKPTGVKQFAAKVKRETEFVFVLIYSWKQGEISTGNKEKPVPKGASCDTRPGTRLKLANISIQIVLFYIKRNPK